MTEAWATPTPAGWKVMVVISPDDLARLSRGDQIQLPVEPPVQLKSEVSVSPDVLLTVAEVTFRMLERRQTSR